jgi:hypothetical protein
MRKGIAGIICVLIMLTGLYVGSAPVAASDYSGTYVRYDYEDCYDTGRYGGLYIYNVEVYTGSAWKMIINAMYPTGFQYLDSDGYTQNVNFAYKSCTSADGTDGSGKHQHTNTITYQTAHDGKFTYIAAFEDQTTGSSFFRITQYLKWENTASDNIQRMGVWWKIEWAINGEMGSGHSVGQKQVSGTWSDIQVASYNQKGSGSWENIRWYEDSSATGHRVYTDNHGGSNLNAYNYASWGDFGLNDPGYPTDLYYYEGNADGHTVATSLGSEWLQVQSITSGTNYGTWSEYHWQWT